MSSNIVFVDPSPTEALPLDQAAIRLHPADDVAIAKVPLQAGTTLILEDGKAIKVRQFINSGHKIALREVAQDQALRRYGQVIGFASRPIQVGEHVHLHNVGMQAFSRQHDIGVDAQPVDFLPDHLRREFMGYKRPNGKVGTRNFIAVISSVNCSAHTCREIAHYFTAERLADFPHIDGVIALTHSLGCAIGVGNLSYTMLQRTLAGFAVNANIGAYVIVGLGCETNQLNALIENYNLQDGGGQPPINMQIQDEGGIRKTVQHGISAIQELLPEVNNIQRTPQPVSELMIGLQCGGSDGWSGITANPLLGSLSDEVVRQGGAVVLAETPEIYGAEHLLTRRAASPEIAEKLLAKIRWWEDYARKLEVDIDNNPSIGNKAGGLTTIYEKSLGAVAKGGTTPLMGVYDYAEPVTARGFTFMDTPGYDPVSATGQVAGGCTLILFTTGRGSCFGFKPAPSIKVSTNSEMYTRMIDDMDFNAGELLSGTSLSSARDALFDLVVEVASGKPSKSEAQGVGEEEFNPWHVGGTM